MAVDVDVYFIAGQSNAANFAQLAGAGPDSVGYNLTFARTRNSFGPNAIEQSFSSGALDASLAVSVLSTELDQSGADQAIYSFARNGTAISNQEPINWYPGADPAGGVVFDGSLYGDFVVWANARLAEITGAGDTPVVKGLFWFQGERDVVVTSGVTSYQTNFENLVYRFRDDFGAQLPIVATNIREVGSNASLRAAVNQAMDAAAASDPLLSVVSPANLPWRSATDLHLSDPGYAQLAPLWADAMLALQIPEPSTGAMVIATVLSIAGTQRRSRR